MGGGHINNRQWVEHTPWPNVAAGLAAAVRSPNQQAARGQRVQIMLGSGVAVHLLVHCGHNRDGRRRGEANGRYQIVRHTGCHAGN